MSTEDSESTPIQSLPPITFEDIPLRRQYRVRRFMELVLEDLRSKDVTDCNALLAALEDARRKQNATQNKKRAHAEVTTQSLFPNKKQKGNET